MTQQPGQLLITLAQMFPGWVGDGSRFVAANNELMTVPGIAHYLIGDVTDSDLAEIKLRVSHLSEDAQALFNGMELVVSTLRGAGG